MTLVRSDEVPDGGETVDLATLQELARVWYGDRMDPDWRPRTRDESQRLLASVGLVGPFWELPPTRRR
jgi:hypothetical protein